MDERKKIIFGVLLEQLIDSSDDESSEDEEIISNFNFRGPIERRPRIENYLTIIRIYNDEEFKLHFRMKRDTFNIIHNLINPFITRSGLIGRKTLNSDLQILITLWCLVTPDSYRSVSTKFGVPKSTVWRYVNKICDVLCNFTPSFIKWPSRENTLAAARSIENRYGFPGVIGAIDGTHIKIAAPREHPESYVNRKGFHSIQLQVICDSSMKIIHTYCGEVGSVHDMRVFRLSAFQQMCTEEYFPEDTHILGDAAYKIHKNILVPYKDNGHLTEEQIHFNTVLSSIRMVVERCFALLKGRFRSLLDKLPLTKTYSIPRYILACCVLHNLCLLNDDVIDIQMSDDLQFQADDNSDLYDNADDLRDVGITKRQSITQILQNI